MIGRAEEATSHSGFALYLDPSALVKLFVDSEVLLVSRLGYTEACVGQPICRITWVALRTTGIDPSKRSISPRRSWKMPADWPNGFR